jgi:hypothetical protein
LITLDASLPDKPFVIFTGSAPTKVYPVALDNETSRKSVNEPTSVILSLPDRLSVMDVSVVEPTEVVPVLPDKETVTFLVVEPTEVVPVLPDKETVTFLVVVPTLPEPELPDMDNVEFVGSVPTEVYPVALDNETLRKSVNEPTEVVPVLLDKLSIMDVNAVEPTEVVAKLLYTDKDNTGVDKPILKEPELPDMDNVEFVGSVPTEVVPVLPDKETVTVLVVVPILPEPKTIDPGTTYVETV